MSQVKDLADQVIVAVKGYISKSLADLNARVEQFETKLAAIPSPLKGDPGERGADGAPGERGEKGDRGSDGKDADHEQITAAVAKAVEAIPRPADGARGERGEKGDPGVAGKDADPEQIAAAVTKAVEALPKPTDGKDGRNAFEVAVSLGFEGDVYAWQESLRGDKGLDGTSVTADQVLPELKAEFQKAVAAIPIPKDGINGRDGKDSTVTADDFRPLVESETTKALLNFERRAQDVLLKAISNIPAPKDGKDGRDGLGFEDLDVTHDGERTFTLKFARGDITKEFAFKVPALLERGVYRQGQSYEKGDCVSFGGSLWIAQKDTGSKPETDDSWRLAVKRGRDGKDGERGQKGDIGPAGRNGRDLTQLGTDGAKW